MQTYDTNPWERDVLESSEKWEIGFEVGKDKCRRRGRPLNRNPEKVRRPRIDTILDGTAYTAVKRSAEKQDNLILQLGLCF